MKISRGWLQAYFDTPLPSVEKLAEALTFHAFEIESIEPSSTLGSGNEVLDVKVTPNRGHDCLSHRGIAKELSAILEIPLKNDPLRQVSDLTPLISNIQVTIESPLCKRYTAGYITHIKVGPSPEWLVKRLESVGQRTINNIVDATNYVMFDLGQPLHAFDAGKLASSVERQASREYNIEVRSGRHGEKMTALDGKEYSLSDSTIVIGDKNANAVIGIAGVKGGLASGVDENTTDIIIEAANFDGVSVRKTARALNLRTDASSRFEQIIAPEYAAYGMRAVVELILSIAGGELQGYVDVFNTPSSARRVSVTTAEVNALLGTSLTNEVVESVLHRLDLSFEKEGDTFVVTPPFERLDIQLPEDLIEEMGRIVGYDTVPEIELPHTVSASVNQRYATAEAVRETYVSEGYSEVITSVFTDKGERAVSNKIGGDKPFLRASLIPGLKEAYEKNVRNKDLLELSEVKLFEIGTVWCKGEEVIMVGSIDAKGAKEESLGATESAYTPHMSSVLTRYEPFSKYPFIVRDVAFWMSGADESGVEDVIRSHAGDLLVRLYRFDRFEKQGKTSLAYRLVFQSPDRTLFEDDANRRMESVYAALKSKGYEIR